MNSVILIGRTTGEPGITYTPSAMAIAKFCIAVDRPPKDGKKEADFVNVKAFGKTAENCGRFLQKGKNVGIQGRLKIDKYTDKEGRNASYTEVIADRVEFLDWGDQEKPKRTSEYAGERFKDPAPMDDGFMQLEADLPF